ncbi:hypothetical protein FOL47_005508, partial [Perkinsus chesapeaki]
TFPTPDDDFDALHWLAKAQAECPHLQRLHEVNPSKYHLNDAGLLHVNGRYMVPKAARLHRPPSGTLKRRREVMELIYVDIVGPLPIGNLGQSKFRYILTWICAASHFI